jgi:hypothetical protein
MIGYVPSDVQEVFARFAPFDDDLPLDLMFVNDRTFEAMFRVSTEVRFGEARARIPSLEHLVALKLHMLRHGSRHRALRHLNDIFQLTRVNRTEVADHIYVELLAEFVLSTGLDTRVRESEAPDCVSTAGVPDVELPEAPDFISEPPRRTLSEMLPFLDEFRRWKRVRRCQPHPERCTVEFGL